MTTSITITALARPPGPLAPSAGRCIRRTLIVFSCVDAAFAVLLSAGYAQISSLPAWTALRLGVLVAIPMVILATAALTLVARSIYRRLQDPDPSEAAIIRAAMGLRRFPQRVVALEIVRWVGAFGLVFAIEQPAHWQPPVFFLITMFAGPLALSFPLTDWCNAPATAELWRSLHARGIALPVRPVSLAARLAFYSVTVVTTAGAYFASFAFAARIKALDPDTMLIAILMFSAAALFFALLSSLVFSTTFTRPLREMSEVVSRIAGDEQLAQIGRVPLRQDDEIGALARLTNAMIDRLARTSTERTAALHALERLNQTLERRVEDRTQELTKVQAVAITNAHRAGMSEISANVLHNVGNVLNSVNVSCDQLESTLRASRAPGLQKVGDLLRAHGDQVDQFLTSDPKGRRLPEYLIMVAESLAQDHGLLVGELTRLKSKVHLINAVITAQQQYASGRFLTEIADITQVVDEILVMQAHALGKSGVRVVKHLAPVDQVPIQRTKLAHVLLNLMKNAEEAMAATAAEHRVLTIEVGGGAQPFIRVGDAGEGISADNLVKLFQHGFTTKPTGHGFGLHSCASSMREMGGRLVATSDGIGRGASFMLQFASAAD
jgi:signal transduction histidine kinase